MSPHELFQAVNIGSNRRFKFDEHADAAEFLTWLLNHLHAGLGGTGKRGSSIVHKALQGAVRVSTSHRPKKGDHADVARDSASSSAPNGNTVLKAMGGYGGVSAMFKVEVRINHPGSINNGK